MSIADAMNRLDDFRLCRVLFDLAPERRNILVERATVGHEILAPGQVEQFIARNRLAAPLEQDFQQRDFSPRQVDKLLAAKGAQGRLVDAEVAHDEWGGGRFRGEIIASAP